MSNRAAKIAGPMLRDRVDHHGDSRIANVNEVRTALLAAAVHPCVVQEWENEACRRNGSIGSVELIGHDYRAAIARARRRQMVAEDRRSGVMPTGDDLIGYRPGIFRRMRARLIELFRRRASRKAARASRRRATR